MFLSIILLLLFVGIASYFQLKGWFIALAGIVGLFVGDVLRGDCSWLAYIIVIAVAVVTCFSPVRRVFTDKILKIFKKVMPPISETEQAAIESGNVWWEGEFFKGNPDYSILENYSHPKLTDEEQAFIDGPVEELCKVLDDWDMVHNTKDLPAEAWDIIKKNRFWGMIIHKKYGGLEFSNYAHAKVVMKVTSRSGSAGVTIMVPNSLGPGELLQRYGTEEQKDYYLPRLAVGEEIPCFALTSPSAGSDAGGIPDFGVVTRGDYTDPITGEEHKDIIGIRVTWEKRWITLAPVATVLGLAFKMFDPEGLLGGKKDIGITCALVPTKLVGVNIGRRHYPSGSVFQNGPTWGKDVFIPLDSIIGGVDYAGRGWTMLIECLSVGRCISLPATACAAGKGSSYIASLYARIRDQFGLPIGKFEGVAEALARIGGHAYQMEASQDLALTALDTGINPSVVSAILKYNNTEKMRKVLNDAMDILGGKAVVMGPRNPLVTPYQSIPVAITVEGANILTRTLMIFGQGAFRCHPYILDETIAASKNDAASFEKLLSAHLHFGFTNAFRSFWLSLTNGKFIIKSPKSGFDAKYYRQITRLSANFALTSDLIMGSLGGELKFREQISGRLADILSNLFIATAVLKRFEKEGRQKEDIPLVQYAAELALYEAEVALDAVIRNLPSFNSKIKPVAWLARFLTLPIGKRLHAPSDKTTLEVSSLLMKNGPSLERLVKGIFISTDEKDPVGVLAKAHEAIIKAEPTEKKVRKLARKESPFETFSPREHLQEALDKNLISKDEFDLVTEARRLKRIVIMVDDFDKDLKDHDHDLLNRLIF